MLLILAIVIFPSMAMADEIYYCNHCDVILGALAPVHQKDDDKSNFGKCKNEAFNVWAMPRVEALLFAVDQVNNDSNILADTKLGIHILDTCGIDTVATEEAKKFIQKEKCNHVNSDFHFDGKCNNHTHFVGVVGEMYSSVSKSLTTFLQPWAIPVVSPASTSVDLSDYFSYKYFARTVPSDKFQFRVILDILKKLKWTLISTLVSEGSFSEEVRRFTGLAKKNGICNTELRRIPKHPTVDDFEDTLCKIFEEEDSNVVILFTNVEDTKRIFNASHHLYEQKSSK